MVIVDPESSSRVALPSRAAVGHPCDLGGEVATARARSASRTTGTMSPSGVWVAMPTCTVVERRQRPRLGVEVALRAGWSRHASTIAPDEERQHREPRRPSAVAWRFSSAAQRFELGRVDRVDIGDVGDLGPRRGEALGDPPAQPDRSSRRGARPARPCRRSRRCAGAGDPARRRSRSACTTRPSGPEPASAAGRSRAARARRPDRRRRRRPAALAPCGRRTDRVRRRGSTVAGWPRSAPCSSRIRPPVVRRRCAASCAARRDFGPARVPIPRVRCRRTRCRRRAPRRVRRRGT